MVELAASNFLFFQSEDRNSRFIKNSGFYIQNYIMSHTKILYYRCYKIIHKLKEETKHLSPIDSTMGLTSFFKQNVLCFYSNSSCYVYYTVKHNTLMLYNNVLHVLVHQNHHWAPLLLNVRNKGAWWWFWWTKTSSTLFYSTEVLCLTVNFLCISDIVNTTGWIQIKLL